MKLRELVLTAMLVSLALVFNIAEGMLPLPLPGVKLGAANVFALAALVLLGVRAAFAVTLLRVALAWLISANWFAFICSITGGLPAVAVMSALYVKFRDDFSLPWISAAGAWAFNIGQITAVSYMVGDARVLWYAPPMLIIGTMTGWTVGRLAEVLCGRIERMYHR